MVLTLAAIGGPAGVVFGIGFLVLGALGLFRGSSRSNIKKDDTPGTTSTRGTRIPLVIGQRRIGAAVSWIGARKTKKKDVGGKGITGEGGSTFVYREAAMHTLAVGPMLQLSRIMGTDGAIYETELLASAVPNGSEIDVDKKGAFRIYWGSLVQPPDPRYAEKVGVTCGFPLMSVVFWDRYKTGTSPRWDDLGYEGRWGCVENDVFSSYALDDGDSWGVNPAAALLQLMTAPYPHGAGMPASWVNDIRLTVLSALMSGEHIPVNLLLGGDDSQATAESGVSGIIADCGLAFVQVQGRLSFLQIRESGSPPVITEDMILERPQIENNVGASQSGTRLVYEFDDETRGYRTSEIVIANDGAAMAAGAFIDKRIQITSVTHPDVAMKVALRRSQLDSPEQQGVKLRLNRAASAFVPGQLVSVAGVGSVRLTEVKYEFDGSATVEGLLDRVSVPVVDDSYGDDPAIDGDGAEHDIALLVLEVPSEIRDGTNPKVAVLRVRANQSISFASVSLSADGGAFFEAGEQNEAAIGGLLDEAMDTTTGTIEVGPAFEPQNDDVLDALDLTAESAEWTNGRQIAVIGGEIMFLESVAVVGHDMWAASTAYSVGDYVEPDVPNGLRYLCTASTGSSGSSAPVWPASVGATVVDGNLTWEARRFSYRMQNLIRAQWSTSVYAHAVGSQVFIMDTNKIEQLGGASVADGVAICAKTSPGTFVDAAPISGSLESCTIVGTAKIVTEAGDQIVAGADDIVAT